MIRNRFRTASLCAALALAGLTSLQAFSQTSGDLDASVPGTSTEPVSDTTTSPVTTHQKQRLAKVTPAQPDSLSTELAKASLARQGVIEPTSDQVAAEAANISAMRASGMGWGAIANSLGVKLGSVVSRLNRSAKANEKEAQRLARQQGTVSDSDAAGEETEGQRRRHRHHHGEDADGDETASDEGGTALASAAEAATTRSTTKSAKAGKSSSGNGASGASSSSSGRGGSASGGGASGGNKGGGASGGSSGGKGGGNGGGNGGGGKGGGNGGGKGGGNGGGKR